MIDREINFNEAPKLICWDDGNIIYPSVLNYAILRSEELNRIKHIKCNKNGYGIFKLNIDENKIKDRVFLITEIECIFSDGLIYFYKYDNENKLQLDLNENKNLFSNETNIYLCVPNGAVNSYVYGEKDSRYKKGKVESVSFNGKKESTFFTLEENSILQIGSCPPLNCSYLVIAKLTKNNGVIELSEYVPPILNIKCNQKIVQIGKKIVELLRKKLTVLIKDIEVFKESGNIISYVESINKSLCIKSSIGAIEPLLESEGITPMQFYLECLKVLSYTHSIESLSDFQNLIPYQHEEIFKIFNLISEKIQIILDHEISDKYRLIKFDRKENYYALKFLNNTLTSKVKIVLRRSKELKDTDIIEWMKSVLICDNRDFHSFKEKRALGFEREVSNIEGVIKEKYLVFNVYTEFKHYNINNELILFQTNSLFNRNEPEEILLYEEKN